jgi:hypothetical protein
MADGIIDGTVMFAHMPPASILAMIALFMIRSGYFGALLDILHILDRQIRQYSSRTSLELMWWSYLHRSVKYLTIALAIV